MSALAEMVAIVGLATQTSGIETTEATIRVGADPRGTIVPTACAREFVSLAAKDPQAAFEKLSCVRRAS